MVTTSRPFSQLFKGRLGAVHWAGRRAARPRLRYGGRRLPRRPPVLIGRIGSNLDDWFTADCLERWTENFIAMRIPDAYFATEAKYNGARVIVVDPNYNVTAAQARRPLRSHPDGERLYLASEDLPRHHQGKRNTTRTFEREQTDLPFLSWEARQQEVSHGEGCEASWQRVPVLLLGCEDGPGRACARLPLDGARTRKPWISPSSGNNPAPGGKFTVRTADGREVECTTVFEMTRRG